MSKAIRLHKDHGLNPTIPTCFFCGEAKNEVVLLGAAYKGEAPMQMVINAEPCDACKEKFALGITLFGVEPHVPGKTMPLNKGGMFQGMGLTGSFAVVSEDFFERVLAPSMGAEQAAQIRSLRKAFVPNEAIDRLREAAGS